ncbi:putative ribosomal N-acetyltransferase YdaF [compost metagenome]
MGKITPRKVVTKSGKELLLRNPTVEDAAALIEFGKMGMSEPDCMVTLPEEFTMTLEDEVKFIQRLVEGPNSVAIAAEYNGEIIGMIDFHGRTNRKRLNHAGAFGMAVYPKFSGDGVGALLISSLLEWAQSHPSLRKVGLAVFSTNEKAIKLYKKMGFLEEGRRIKEVQIKDGTFIDDIIMYKWLEK